MTSPEITDAMTEISDKAVEAAASVLAEHRGRKYVWSEDEELAEAALSAALPHLGAAGVAVRELEWKEDGCPDAWRAQALPLLGSYIVFKDGDKWSLYFARLYCGHHESPEAAKAFAQADFGARIRSALVPSPVPREAEPKTFMGCRVVSDPTIAPHAGELRDRDGNVLARFDFGAPVPQEATAEPVAWDPRALAVSVANIRQGQSSTPRCAPPGEADIEIARTWVDRVLAAQESKLSRASPPSHDAELLAAREALAAVKQAILNADPEVLTCTLWMPDDHPNETVVDFIDAALEAKP